MYSSTPFKTVWLGSTLHEDIITYHFSKLHALGLRNGLTLKPNQPPELGRTPVMNEQRDLLIGLLGQEFA
jgi:hypothetical protein